MFATFPQLLEEKNWKQKKISKLFRLMQNFLHSKLTARALFSNPKVLTFSIYLTHQRTHSSFNLHTNSSCRA